MPESQRTAAIVLGGRDLGESDRIITFFTPSSGKLVAVARGAKRSLKRFVNSLEPFTYLDLLLVAPRAGGIPRIDAAEAMECFHPLRENVNGFFLGSLCCELVDKWTRENDAHEGLFQLLLWVLRELSENPSGRQAALAFQARLLGFVGYAPRWTRCVYCKELIRGGRAQVRPEEGGFACPSCGRNAGCGLTVGLGALKSLEFIQNQPLSGLGRLTMVRPVFDEAWTVMRILHSHHLRSEPFSYSLLSRSCA